MSGKITLILVVLSLLVAPASAVELQAVGGATGWTGIAGHLGNTYMLRLFADLGPIRPDLFLVPDLNRWRSSKTVGDEEIIRTSLILSANLLYNIPTSRVKIVKPYAGGGLGIQRMNRETVQGVWSTSSGDIDIGLNLLGGITYLATPRLRLNGEARYTLLSIHSHLSLSAGAALMIYR